MQLVECVNVYTFTVARLHKLQCVNVYTFMQSRHSADTFMQSRINCAVSMCTRLLQCVNVYTFTVARLHKRVHIYTMQTRHSADAPACTRSSGSCATHVCVCVCMYVCVCVCVHAAHAVAP